MIQRWLISALFVSVCFGQSDVEAQSQQQSEDKRIFLIFPNYKTLPKYSDSIPPLSAKEKFAIAAKDSFDPATVILAGAYAGVGQLSNQYPTWGLGAQGYGKRLAAAYADQALSNFGTEAVMPVLFKQDPRYFRKGEGSAKSRTFYALSRIVITRGDSHKRQFNFSEILGNGMGASVASLYYPREDRTAGQVIGRWGGQVGADAFFNVMKEFWPDIRNRVFHK
jgi:hypothetical protein